MHLVDQRHGDATRAHQVEVNDDDLADQIGRLAVRCVEPLHGLEVEGNLLVLNVGTEVVDKFLVVLGRPRRPS